MTQLINKLELSFWDVTIPLLSDSLFVRSSVKKAYGIFRRKLVLGSIYIFSWGGLGLITGYCLAHYRIIH